MKFLAQLTKVIDSVSEFSGKIFGWLILVMIIILCLEITLRGVFNAPTLWVHEGSQYFFAAHFALAGAYALKLGAMVNVDIFVNKLKPRTRAIVDILTATITLLFIGAMVWKGFDLAVKSVLMVEKSQTIWGPPIYPLKITLLVGAFLLGMQALAKLIRDFVLAVKGKALL